MGENNKESVTNIYQLLWRLADKFGVLAVICIMLLGLIVAILKYGSEKMDQFLSLQEQHVYWMQAMTHAINQAINN